jgi:carbon monoxide dehydrogenase subunit G
MAEPLVVRRETHIAAPPATVFAFLTDPEKILGAVRGVVGIAGGVVSG